MSNLLANRIHHAGLDDIFEKVQSEQRLTREDGLRLYACNDADAVAHMANIVRERLHGDFTYYNINRHINYSNICILSCKFCAFGKKAKDDDGEKKHYYTDTEKAAMLDAAAEIEPDLYPVIRFNLKTGLRAGELSALDWVWVDLERRTLAIRSSSWMDPRTAADLGRLDPAAIARVRHEAWPEPRDADELHDALMLHGFLTEAEGRRGALGGFGFEDSAEADGPTENELLADADDNGAREGWLALFDELNQSGNTVVLVTHEDDIAEHARRVVKLRDGKILSDERTRE